MKIEQDAIRTHVFLAPMIAIAVPATVFRTGDDRVTFTQELQRHIAEHQGSFA